MAECVLSSSTRRSSKINPDWIQASSTLDLVNDYSNFVIAYFEVINTSAPHIYHSALSLSPQTSIVRRLCKPYARPFARVVHGLPVSWEPTASASEPHSIVRAAAWSPCSRLIAVSRIDPTRIEILDSVTLERLNNFTSPNIPGHLSFSPDGHLLVSLSGDTN